MTVVDESVWFATLNEAERRELCEVPSAPAMSTPDLMVSGSGIIGLATAYFAAERGLKVQVVTTDARLGADAELSLGLIDPNVCRWQFSPETQQLAQSSRDWWAKLAVRPEFQIDWRVTGALMVDAERLRPHPRQHMLAALEEGYSVHDVDAEQVALLEPALGPRPLGGLHYPSEAVLHPLKAAVGFIKGIRRRGGQFSRIDEGAPMLVDGSRFTGLDTSAGRIRPRNIVVDNQPWESTRHTFLATASLPPLLKRPVLDVNWILQLKTGELVVEASGMREVDQIDGERAIEKARALVPELRDVAFDRRWTGTGKLTPDRQPQFGKHLELENCWNYGGFNFSQVLFAPIVGKSIADEIT